WKEPVANAARKLWIAYYKDRYEVEPGMQEASKLRRQPDAYDECEERQAVVIPIEDEFDRFINDPPVKLPKNASALDWWLNPSNCINYPSLYRMAIDILSIPPMSAEPERIFSGAWRTILWQRMKLGPVNIERIECLKSWIRTGLVAGSRKELMMKLDIQN